MKKANRSNPEASMPQYDGVRTGFSTGEDRAQDRVKAEDTDMHEDHKYHGREQPEEEKDSVKLKKDLYKEYQEEDQ